MYACVRAFAALFPKGLLDVSSMCLTFPAVVVLSISASHTCTLLLYSFVCFCFAFNRFALSVLHVLVCCTALCGNPQVHGLVAELIDVADASTGTALEITAGGKLFNVVVQDEVVGKKLLSRGQLKRRVTIIPLSKIASNPIKDDVVQRAKREVGGGGGNAIERHRE